MRRLSLAVLALAVVALTAAGLGAAARLGLFQAGTPPAGYSRLDPQAQASGTGGSPLPADACTPAQAATGPAASDADFGGPCAFHQSDLAYCRSAADDFYVLVHRALPAERTFDMFIDVEFYRGPGTYSAAQSLLIIQDGTTLYTWSNFRTGIVVLPHEAGVRLGRTELTPEAGRAGAGVETMSGTLRCGGPSPG